MSRWWRAYDDAVDDPKLQRLPGELFKSWFNLLCLASRNNGKLPPLDDLCFGLRRSSDDVMATLKHLQECGLIDKERGVLRPHNWDGRQFISDNSTERVQRYRKRLRNVTGNGHATSSVTDQNRAETDSEKRLSNEGSKRESLSRRTPT